MSSKVLLEQQRGRKLQLIPEKTDAPHLWGRSLSSRFHSILQTVLTSVWETSALQMSALQSSVLEIRRGIALLKKPGISKGFHHSRREREVLRMVVDKRMAGERTTGT